METNQLILLSIYITTIRNLDASRLACLFNDDCFGAERQFAGPLVTKLISLSIRRWLIAIALV